MFAGSAGCILVSLAFESRLVQLLDEVQTILPKSSSRTLDSLLPHAMVLQLG